MEEDYLYQKREIHMTVNKDIVLFTFGPVQTFIAASRRTQDLAVSSLILSSLAKSGLKHIEKNQDLELIFPLRTSSDWAKRLPNRIVFLSPMGHGKNYAEEVQMIINDRWNFIADDVRAFIQKNTSSNSWESQWNSQVKEWLECYWVAVPWDGQDKTYANAFKILNLGIDARKNVRHYPTTPQKGAKCTLSGIRSAIGVDKIHNINIWEEIRGKISLTELRDNEQLSAISAIKRFANHTKISDLNLERFPSTSSIAVASFKKQILLHWPESAELVDKFIAAIGNLGLIIFPEPEPFPALIELIGSDASKKMLMRLEGDYFYKEFFTIDKINESRREKLPKLLESPQTTELISVASKALTALINKMAELAKNNRIDAPFPNTYFAALVMDGDHMGKMINNAGSLEVHKHISQTMADTASQIEDIVEKEYPGVLVYSSGDDVLALLPVNCALEVAQKVREKFKENMKEIGQQGEMSGGIAIMHHRSPLEAILTKARKAEYKAKEIYNRSTLVISIIKRSGEDLTAAMKWPPPNYKNPLIDLLEYLSMGWISSKFIYDLRQEEKALATYLEGFILELRRILKRHTEYSVEGLDIEDLTTRLIDFRRYMPPEEDRIPQMIHWLMVTGFLAKGERS
jgi:CRISPR-associated protein Cmr2